MYFPSGRSFVTTSESVSTDDYIHKLSAYVFLCVLLYHLTEGESLMPLFTSEVSHRAGPLLSIRFLPELDIDVPNETALLSIRQVPSPRKQLNDCYHSRSIA